MRRLVPRSFVSVVLTLAAPAVAQEAPPKPPEIAVALHADDGRATLERRASVESPAGFPFPDASLARIETWTPACVAPCAEKLDPRFSYRVSGDGLVPSGPFLLPQGRESVVVDARMGSAYGRVGGMLIGGAGVGALLLGGVALVATPILEDRNVGSPALRTGVLAGGVGLVGIGVLAVGTGLWLWLHNGTQVRLDALPTTASHAGPTITTSGIAF
jgi:hypothetical protein